MWHLTHTHTPEPKVIEDFGRHLQKPEYDVGETTYGNYFKLP